MAIYNVPPTEFGLRLWDRDILNVTAGGYVDNLVIGDGAVANVDTPDATGVRDTRIMGGGTLNVAKGYAKYTTIDSKGVATFYTDSTALLTTLDGGQLIAIGGNTLYTTINSGEQSIQGRGVAFFTKIVGGIEVVYGTSNDPQILAGGTQRVASAGTVNKAILEGGSQELFGRAFETTIRSGTQTITGATAVADHTTMNGGLQVVRERGTANFTAVEAGAQRIENGGTANHAAVADEGLQTIEAGGVSTYATVEGGGTQSVAGTASFTTIGTGGKADVLAGGTTSHTTLSSGAILTVHDGGTANDTLHDGGGFLRIEAGGTSNDTKVTSGGTEFVLGTANGTTVGGAAEQSVRPGGTANQTTIEAGGIQNVAGTANDTTIMSSGRQVVAATGTSNDIAFEGNRGSLSLVNPSNLTGTIASWMVGNVIDFTKARVTEILETADDRLIVSWGSGAESRQVTYTLVDEQADTHVAFASSGQGGTKLFLEADSGSRLLAAFVQLDSAAAGTLGSGTIGLAGDGSGGARVVLDAMDVKADLLAAGAAVPDGWFATMRGTDRDDWIRGGAGNDRIDGGGGDDVVVYSQAARHYTLTTNGGVITVEDRSGHDGTDTLTDIDRLEFQGSVLDATLLTIAATLSRQQLGDLAELYAVHLGRAPDAPGLVYWASRMADGMPLTEVSRSFSVQPETTDRYPVDREFIEWLYLESLGRPADDLGKAYWYSQLANGNLRRDDLVLAIIEGAKAPTGNPVDALLLANKEAVGLRFALDHGLGDVDWARQVMRQVDATEESVALAYRMADGFGDQAVTTDQRLVLPLVSAAGSASRSVASGDWLDPATWSANAVPGRDVNVAVSAETVVTLEAQGYSGELAIEADARLELLENGLLSVTRILNHGELEVHGGGYFFTAGWSDNNGTISATDGGRIEFYGRLKNFGTVVAEGAGSVIEFRGGFNNANHVVQVIDGAQIDFASGKASQSRDDGQADLLGDGSTLKIRDGGHLGVAFHAGHQTLVLGKSNEYQGRVTGFEAGDRIHVLDVDATSPRFEASYDSGGSRPTLTLSDGFVEASIVIVGVQGELAFTSDGGHGTLVELVA